MKRYLLNHNCIYNEACNEIKNRKNATKIKMTTMRSRCLSYIIDHASAGIIDRKEIADFLWGERGQYVSDANLTQLLYLVRKDLRTVGIDDFFVTVPRIGIRVNTDVAVEELKKDKVHHPGRIKPAFITIIILLAFSIGITLEILNKLHS